MKTTQLTFAASKPKPPATPIQGAPYGAPCMGVVYTWMKTDKSSFPKRRVISSALRHLSKVHPLLGGIGFLTTQDNKTPFAFLQTASCYLSYSVYRKEIPSNSCHGSASVCCQRGSSSRLGKNRSAFSPPQNCVTYTLRQ